MNLVIFFYLQEKNICKENNFFLNNSHKLRHLNIKYMFLACIEPILVTLLLQVFAPKGSLRKIVLIYKRPVLNAG